MTLSNGHKPQMAASFVLGMWPRPAARESRRTLWRDGSIVAFGEGLMWNVEQEFARRLMNVQDGTVEAIRDAAVVVLSRSSKLVVCLVEGYSGAYVCRVEESTLCLPLGCGRLRSGLRVAQPVRTNGPKATCLNVSNEFICVGDAWGAVAVWPVSSSQPNQSPRWSFGAHGKMGCAFVRSVGTNMVVTCGSALPQEIRIWVLCSDGQVEMSKEFLLPDDRVLSTNVAFMTNGESSFVFGGAKDGYLHIFELTEHGKQSENTALTLQVFKRSAVALLESYPENLLVLGSADGEVVVLRDPGNIRTKVIAMGNLTGSPALGIFENSLVFNESLSLAVEKLSTMLHSGKDQLSSGKESAEEDRVDLMKAIDYLYHTHAVRSTATMIALNRPKDYTETFGQDLIPVDPSKIHHRICCEVDIQNPFAEGEIWVKRRVAPKFDLSRRRPLYEVKHRQQANTIVDEVNDDDAENEKRLPERPLPPFCRFRRDLSTTNLFLSEKNGRLYVSIDDSY